AHGAFADADGYTAPARAEALLLGLGFTLEQTRQSVSSFSGGWRMRLNLAQALMCRSDLLLLDEPTNHLDLDAIVWLEDWLHRYPGTLVVISHDREFLDSICNVTLHLENQQIKRYGGNYSQFEILRAQRLALLDPGSMASELQLLAEIQLEKIQATIEAEKPDVAVIDSIQTIYSEALTSAPGSVAQVRECAAQLTRIAKQSGTAIIMVGHVTKEGNLAGPRVLEHIVDTVLYFEGDTHSSFRLVRAFKNRFGAVNELGVFAMTEKGLRGVANPSALFLSQHEQSVPGSCVLVTQEGSRPLLVEVQALVDTAHVPNPRRLAVGLEQNRLAMLLAVLHRHAGIACFDQDVFLNAVGGVKITEPAADLAVLLAIHSSMRNKALPKGLIVFGEVGLAGEIRPSPRGQDRLKEAAKLGFSCALIPRANAPKQPIEGLQVIAVERLEEAIDRIRELD
ncbi:DNA repair protein RadA, partial [Paraburkholderia sp. BR14262]|uniref:DNA repair protein RadA n=1 Tax=Paraburkholderia sp. BR14262 TaxID=3236999 RepID=UPI0034CD911A